MFIHLLENPEGHGQSVWLESLPIRLSLLPLSWYDEKDDGYPASVEWGIQITERHIWSLHLRVFLLEFTLIAIISTAWGFLRQDIRAFLGPFLSLLSTQVVIQVYTMMIVNFEICDKKWDYLSTQLVTKIYTMIIVYFETCDKA